MLEKMKALAKQRDICVLATVADGVPHCSLMAYITNDDCSEIYMVTDKKSRKYENLLGNPSVSLLMDTREEHTGVRRPEAKALTVHGLFQEMADDDKAAAIRRRLLEKHPHLLTFFDRPHVALFSIKITSFLLLDGLSDAHFETI
jgi:nitroimidazol reductase NimA-like FMN-containing flavoprotein (pyridoxamine 5'-phosphate oxidase superfamily)